LEALIGVAFSRLLPIIIRLLKSLVLLVGKKRPFVPRLGSVDEAHLASLNYKNPIDLLRELVDNSRAPSLELSEIQKRVSHTKVEEVPSILFEPLADCDTHLNSFPARPLAVRSSAAMTP
jgi:hypothetical protein